MPPNIKLFLFFTIFPLLLYSQNITEYANETILITNLTHLENFSFSASQFSSFLIDINDTIDIDYLSDDSSTFWQFSNTTIETSISTEPPKVFAKVTKPKQLIGDIHWPTKYESVVEGDVILGGLMMVHEREDNATCGPIMPQGGIQALEAMLFTLDRINEMKLLGPDVKIGAHILDDCDKDTYGLEMAVDFIKGEFLKFF
ncbi:hypothetical protein PVAND_014546 [Polypedilum vanderplanki]|uniref:Receptor ligand binding region domain-containing protein n=1 Tax=Polypedilum vanderplanki TaxID=319348 RepID=A0A9J6BA11_POLVA|nr:hypothetical protein PVAND_014546 [Polypedilum vanderplanki]